MANYASGTGYAPYSTGSTATSTSIGVGTTPAGLIQNAYDRLLEFGLRAQPLFRSVADKRPAQQAMPGNNVVFQLYQDIDAATTALTETSDVGFVSPGSPSAIQVALVEYGNSVVSTRKLELLALSDVDPALANMIAFNCADSIDFIVRAVLDASFTSVPLQTWTTTGTGSTTIGNYGASGMPAAIANTATTNLISSQAVRFMTAKLRANNVVPRRGNLYASYIHPEVSVDLRAESGAGSWREAHAYAAPDVIWPGEIGTYEGAYFIETPRAAGGAATLAGQYGQVGAGAGATQCRVYNTYFFGQQALAEACAVEPQIVQGPVVDRLNRFRPLGWYAMLGWSLYRSVAYNLLKTSSSIHPVL